MSSGFPGSVQEFYGGPDGISNGRSVPVGNNIGNLMQGGVQVPYGSQLPGIVSDPASQIAHRRSDLIGKRSLVEFQQQQQQLQFLQQQRQGALGLYLRNVKPRTYQHSSPISPLSPVDLSALSSISSNSNSPAMNARYGVPILQQFRPQLSMPAGSVNINGVSVLPSGSGNPNYASGFSFPNSVQNRAGLETEKKMMNRLQELEKQLLDDIDEEEEGDTVSAVTNSEWSETIQSLISPAQTPTQTQTQGPTEYQNQNNKPQISPSPTSSTSSCASSMECPAITCPKQAISEAATAIAEGKNEVASEILTRLAQVANVKGTAEQRLTAYMTSALRSRVSPVEYPPPLSELHTKEHEFSTQKLYEASPCFKLGFMAANLAILDAVSEQRFCKLHVIDFDIGEGGQYLHLLYALAARKAENPTVLKITTFADVPGGDQQLRAVEVELQKQAQTAGVCLSINILPCSNIELSRERLSVDSDEALVVNFAFNLYKLPDESVTTENRRDELLRRVKALSPTVVTVVEQELNGNTAPFVARVNEACGYYGALFDSLDATVSRENIFRVGIEEGLGRKMGNSVACEGRDRVERCEVLGKWRARLSMAGFTAMPMSQQIPDSLRSKLNSGTRGNPGFTITEQAGGIGFGWMGRTLAVASAWR
ncbi:PREDICTED: scarecrow-like protein 8 [Ipomoea nil]|uniref:scarecrow-like protein 8 n=1 Tax=Ipomoea nil TaxID=35883 RepID=UPI000900FF63|nr:PREDICTED: scarecrow-like protein 8 [Ipomoea nil]